MPWPSAVATAIVVVLGFAMLALGTERGSIWTAEAARRAAVLERPQQLPSYRLMDTQGQSVSLAQLERPLTVVDFIYTRCPTLCTAMGSQFRQLQYDLAKSGLADQVQLLSITFDSEHDDHAALAHYLKRFAAVTPHWRAARFDSDLELALTLQDLGVVVIPEPNIGFVHNAAFYLIEAGRIVQIFDIDNPTALLDSIRVRAALRP